MTRRSIVSLLALVFVAVSVRAADPPDFRADAVFTGSSLTGWRPVGEAQWTASNGEIVARPTSDAGGWLMLDKPLQDLQFFANAKCVSSAVASAEAGACKIGVLLRAEKTADGMRGIFVSFADGDFVPYRVTLNPAGRITNRERVGNPPAPGKAATNAAALALKRGEWNPIRVNLWANTVRLAPPGLSGALPDTGTPNYGSLALYVGGTGEVRFKDVAWKDISHVALPKEQVSSRFTVQRPIDMYYGWSAAASDINKDGTMDIVSGPFVLFGPAYTDRHL